MPASVRLDAKTEAWVRRTARRRGVTRSEVIRDALRRAAAAETSAGGESLYDAIKDDIGTVKGGRSDLSVRTGDKAREMLRRRRDSR